MKTFVLVLLAVFGASTVMRQEARGEHCDNCEKENSCSESDVAGTATGHAHGDADDRHETPDSPCHHHQESHCCCAHLPTLTLAQGLEWDLHRVSEAFTLGNSTRLDESPTRELFHVPIA